MSLDLTLLPLVAGPAASLAAEGAKRLPQVPDAFKTTPVVRLGVAVLSVGAAFAAAYFNGQLGSFDFNTAVNTLVGAVATYAVAVTAHDHLSGPAPTPVPVPVEPPSKPAS